MFKKKKIKFVMRRLKIIENILNEKLAFLKEDLGINCTWLHFTLH